MLCISILCVGYESAKRLQIQEEFNKTQSKLISYKTAPSLLLEVGLKGCVTAQKPLLQPVNNKNKTMVLDIKHIKWCAIKWKRVLRTDESKFELFHLKCRQYARRKKGERMIKQCTVPTWRWICITVGMFWYLQSWWE